MTWLGHFLESYPELAVFLAVGIGYILGDVKIAGIAFGPVTGSLLAGLAIGQFAEVPISGMAKSFLWSRVSRPPIRPRGSSVSIPAIPPAFSPAA